MKFWNNNRRINLTGFGRFYSWLQLRRCLILAWAVAVASIWILGLYIGKTSTPSRAGVILPRTAVETLSTFDGLHYEEIAQSGYSIEGQERRRFALFPLLPVIARALGGQEQCALAGILFNQLCLLGSVLILSKFPPGAVPLKVYQQPGFWLLTLPLGFFFSVFYAESLLLLLSLLMVVACRKKMFAAAFIAGVLAGLTRPTAICLPALLIVELFYAWKCREHFLATLTCFVAPFVGIAAYLVYVDLLNGDAHAYVAIQQEWWGAQARFPFQVLVGECIFYARLVKHGSLPAPDELIRLFSTLGILILMALHWRKLDRSFLAYLVIAMLFIQSQEPHSRTARYELILFPIPVLLAQLLGERVVLARIVATLFVMMQALFFVHHTTWRWVS